MAETEKAGSGYVQAGIAGLAVSAIAAHLLSRFGNGPTGLVLGLPMADLPLVACLILVGIPRLWEVLSKLRRGEFGSDFLACLSILTSVLIGEYLTGTLVVLMLAGGEALEAFAIKRASSVLAALAARLPSVAHRKQGASMIEVAVADVEVGDSLLVFPHEICPVDGTVVEGRGEMDESFLTGEPSRVAKAPGASVISGAINGESPLTIRAEALAVDSRYARIMEVTRASEPRRLELRRLGDRLGALSTPLAVAIALWAWLLSGDSRRFLAVVVVATSCPLLIAIPVAIIGSISMAARRGILIKDPTVLETIDTCRTAIFDKTGTLTLGRPTLDEVIPAPGLSGDEVLVLVASLERYSKHPLAGAILDGAKAANLPLRVATTISEQPGQGLTGVVDGRTVRVTSRTKLEAEGPAIASELPPMAGGLESVALIDDRYAATFRFLDVLRPDAASFLHHLGAGHRFDRIMIVSGDRESEVRYLADRVGITEIHADLSPKEMLELVREATLRENTVYFGDGVNDVPAMTATTVGIAFGQNSDITTRAAVVVIMDNSIHKVDEFFQISRRLRAIALRSAIGGTVLSLIGMAFAAFGLLPPVAGAITREVIDVLAVLHALRAAIPPRTPIDD